MTGETAHHNEFCWRLGDAIHFHMRAHPYALNGIFLAGTHYSKIFLRWAARIAMEKFIGKDEIIYAVKESSDTGKK